MVPENDGNNEPNAGNNDPGENKEGGEVNLQSELAEAKAKVAEFRESNIQTRRQLEETRTQLQSLSERFKGIDLDKYKRAMSALDRIEGEDEKRLIEDGKIDEVVNRRTQVMRESFDGQLSAKDQAIKAREEELGKLRARLGTYEIHGAVTSAMEEQGFRARPGALPDIYSRADQIFTMDEEGKLATRPGHFGEDGNPMQPASFISQLADKAAHLFESGKGGGAEGAEAPRGKNTPTVNRLDPVAMGRNLEDIAKGKVRAE